MAHATHLKTIEVNDTELHYVEQGAGVPVVFVHGGLGDFRTWGQQMEPFAEHYHAISYSRRAHYPNAWRGDYTSCPMDLHIEDLAALIRALDVAPAHLVANSYGGYICLFVALRCPELVRSMSLAEPPVHPMLLRLPGGRELFEQFMTSAWEPAGKAFAVDDLEGGVRLFIEGAVGKGEYEKLPPRVREGMMKNALEMKAATVTDFSVHMPDLTCEDAARIKAPTLLLLGENSPKKYSLINNELARCMANTEQAPIPGAAHVLHSQNPEEHNRVVLDFLARH